MNEAPSANVFRDDDRVGFDRQGRSGNHGNENCRIPDAALENQGYPLCPDCGGLMIPQGGCFFCPCCGYSPCG